MLAGIDLPERGTVSLSPPTATVGYLPQERDRRGGETVREVLARRTGVAAAQRALDAASVALERGERGADDAYAVALERWLGLGAADLDERADAVTAELRSEERRVGKGGRSSGSPDHGEQEMDTC